MMRQLEELIGLVQAWIDRQDAEGCGGCVYSEFADWDLPCRHCKRRAKDYWTGRQSRKWTPAGKRED